jgi:hypothetical protein
VHKRRGRTATKATIVSEIIAKVGKNFPFWRIGLTHDLTERKKYWGGTCQMDTSHWTTWQAESLSDAQDVESAFINKGMKGGTGGSLSSRYNVFVYIF